MDNNKVIYRVQSSKLSTKKFECIPMHYFDFTDQLEAIEFCNDEVKEGNEVILRKLT